MIRLAHQDQRVDQQVSTSVTDHAALTTRDALKALTQTDVLLALTITYDLEALFQTHDPLHLILATVIQVHSKETVLLTHLLIKPQ